MEKQAQYDQHEDHDYDKNPVIQINSLLPTDVWSLSVVIIELITLEHPFADKKNRRLLLK